jgi:hypothetical protein
MYAVCLDLHPSFRHCDFVVLALFTCLLVLVADVALQAAIAVTRLRQTKAARP